MGSRKARSKILRRLVDYILACILLVSFSACTPDSVETPIAQAEWQLRWLQGVPCRSPCWEGITPGHTTVAEAIESLRSNPLINARAIAKVSNVAPGQASITWLWVNSSIEGGRLTYNANDENGSVIYLIQPDLPYYRLGDVIQSYGAPSHIMAWAHPSPDGPNYYAVRILFKPQGILLFMADSSRPSLRNDRSITFLICDMLPHGGPARTFTHWAWSPR
jgi:hypothetical protein